MSETVSALNGVTNGDGIAKVTELGLQGMITLRGDLAAAGVKAAATAVAGVDMPGARGITHVGARAIAWMSPDELLVLVPHAEADAAVATMTETLAGAHALVTNVSDARAMFRIEGPAAREVIAKLAPVDLAPSAFGPGQIRRTRLAQVPAAIWMPEDDVLELICFRSVAAYVFNLLCVAAQPGSEVGALS